MIKCSLHIKIEYEIIMLPVCTTSFPGSPPLRMAGRGGDPGYEVAVYNFELTVKCKM